MSSNPISRVKAKSHAAANGLLVEHALYRETGDWYHVLERFPAALLDQNGYIFFQDLGEYEHFVAIGNDRGIVENREKNWLTVKDGIGNLQEYKLFEQVLYPDEVADHNLLREGAKSAVFVNRFERNAYARSRCIRKWGCNCFACDANFSTIYGVIGDGFIHVHHLIPISDLGGEYAVNPESDLRPVCPNCHAMLHRQNPPFSIEELREHMRVASGRIRNQE